MELNLISPKHTAVRLGIAVQTLSIWRTTKRYDLPYVKVGRKVMYRLTDIEAFIAARMRG